MKTWKIRKGDGDFIAIECIETKNDRTFSYDICCMDENYHSRSDKEKNARIIAAAPQMLYALESLVSGLPSEYDDKYTNYLIESAKKAILIAKGEKQ